MAFMARFLWGFLNGNIGVAKSYLSEILDNSNMAKGFSILGRHVIIIFMFSTVYGRHVANVILHFRVMHMHIYGFFP